MPQALINREKQGTRDRIVGFLLKQPSTIARIAEELGITPNGVRAQIALLEREGIVEVQDEQKGPRRPSAVYGLRPGAELRPSRAYPAITSALVRVLAQRLPDREFEAVMGDLGKRLADAAPRPAGSPRERVEAAIGFLKSLGSSAEMSVSKGKITITGHGCPIARIVQTDARSCMAMESLLTELTGLPVEEHCDHGQHPSCRFDIAVPVKK